jgi:oligopeptidase B
LQNFVSPDLPPQPIVPEIPFVHVEHGIEREDPYHWLRDRATPEVLEHLHTENAYTASVMDGAGHTTSQLFKELISRIEESTESAPWQEGQWIYRSRIEAGQQYPKYERRAKESEAEWTTFFDAETEAKDSAFFDLGFLDVSPDGTLLAYAIDREGDETYSIHFRDLRTGTDLADKIDGVSAMGEWNTSGDRYFFVREDEARRPYQLFLHKLGSDQPAKLLYEEKDPLFYLGLEKSQDMHYLFAVSESQETTEVQFLPADLSAPTFAPLLGRKTGHQYSVEHYKDDWIILSNQDAPDFQLFTLPVGYTDLAKATNLVPPREGIRIESVLPLQDYLVLFERAAGLDRIHILETATQASRILPTDDPVYEISAGHNAEFNVAYLDIEYSSPIRPNRTIRYHLNTGTNEILKEQKVPSGHNPDDYIVERVQVPSHDGVAIPMTLVYAKSLSENEPHPAYVYGYGAYGSPVYTGFRTSWLTWLQRDFIVAIPHVRGGGLLGEEWYQKGKLEYKENSFADCLACVRFLINSGKAKPGRVALHGGSAGGLLVGAVLNLDPKPFGAVVAEVPFVDVLNTMLDPSLPLTQFEYEEWGNPQNREVFDRIRRYAPYEAIRPQHYPPILATAGFNDPRVPYWEAAKWVARLRKNQLAPHSILLKTDLESGHGGPSGRYREWQEIAFVQSFILSQLAD